VEIWIDILRLEILFDLFGWSDIRFGLLEIRFKNVPRPVFVSQFSPVIDVLLGGVRPEHEVYGAGAAELFASGVGEYLVVNVGLGKGLLCDSSGRRE